ncbi:FUSC family protein [Streptomyces sp. SID8374]|uniref:FUSC family protein n=1 Tax=Streptomyces sp. SID8374 TaxID=2690354 RepID=UPI00136FBD69|nr:FUSC family protein [Streptomyces sp. SID8374]MYX18310.1 FUSC family protein [Streptomyces sp. SID8374]
MVPLLLAVLADRPTAGVPVALGAMFAGINDRPGGRRSSVSRVGVPALAGAAGLLVGSLLPSVGPPGAAVFVLPLLLGALGLLAGALSSTGPLASACGTQLLVAAVIGAGMPLPESGGERALLFLAGAGWAVLLRLVLPSRFLLLVPPSRRPGGGGPYLYDGEREAVAGVYAAVAGLLRAAGGSRAPARRAALTAALDQAQDALSGPRLRRYASSAAERRLHAQYAAALPLAEAATALAWAGEPLPDRVAEGPLRLAHAVRTGSACGPLPAPARSGAGLRALDDALLAVAEAFDHRAGQSLRTARGRPGLVRVLRRAFGPAGREYGVRVALCCGISAAAALGLDHEHWYWMPATAVFLVKPDLGPLVSRVLSRAAGTVVGAAVFAGFFALVAGPLPAVAAVAVCGALIPVATRHFAAQTAVVTVLVLSLVLLAGEPQAAWGRVVESLTACAIVVLVGHLPLPGQRGHRVRDAVDTAVAAAHRYLRHVLAHPQDGTGRGALRRDAYRSLAAARAAVDLSAAELPPVAGPTAGFEEVAGALERLVDTTTACAVHLHDGSGELPAPHAERIAAHLAAVDAAHRASGRSGALV